MDTNQIDGILKEFINSDKGIHATLAIDAASFKEVKGEIILQKFQSLTTTHGKMRDCYPLKNFSSNNILKAISEGDWSFIFYSLPFNLRINSIYNPNFSNESRKYIYNLETFFLFLATLPISI